MQQLFTLTFLAFSCSAYGQIHQDVNNNDNSTDSNPISEIDSIRFNGSLTEMEIIFLNSSIESHTISEIDNVTFSGDLVGEISSLNCAGAFVNGSFTEGVSMSVFANIGYIGGNGGSYDEQTVNSAGVTGLTAFLPDGNFENGIGGLGFTLSGTANSSGIATFSLNIGGVTCNLTVEVQRMDPYPDGYVHCGGPTQVVEVTNFITGRTWMDRNLGASQVATSETDEDAYGDLYQWGRGPDGHQCRNSPTTGTPSPVDQPMHGNFILAFAPTYNWRNPPNPNLWQGVNGINNPCPFGYRLPTQAEFDAERQTWSTDGADGAFSANVKLTRAGSRDNFTGMIGSVGSFGRYWTSTYGGTGAFSLLFGNNSDSMGTSKAANGRSVRCIMDE